MKSFFTTALVLGIAVSTAHASNKSDPKTPMTPGAAPKLTPPMSTAKSVAHDKITSSKKFDIQGNKNVAKLPGYKSDPKMHTQYCSKYKVPSYLHSQCFFHHDFCWNHTCWLPNYRCCGYWHPYSCCWYYWYAPCCCYLPCSCIETYAPAAVVSTATVVTVTSTSAATSAAPALPVGASAEIPAGVNPVIPAPKQ